MIFCSYYPVLFIIFICKLSKILLLKLEVTTNFLQSPGTLKLQVWLTCSAAFPCKYAMGGRSELKMVSCLKSYNLRWTVSEFFNLTWYWSWSEFINAWLPLQKCPDDHVLRAMRSCAWGASRECAQTHSHCVLAPHGCWLYLWGSSVQRSIFLCLTEMETQIINWFSWHSMWQKVQHRGSKDLKRHKWWGTLCSLGV